MKKYGLIGKPLTHSFSKKYFSEKFVELGIEKTNQYDLYELKEIEDFPKLLENDSDIKGINVTIPYKQEVIPFLNKLDTSAKKVGAVNVINKEGEKLIGYNSDFYGFKKSLLEFLDGKVLSNALVLGYGGAAKAIVAVLNDLSIFPTIVSRRPSEDAISYEETDAVIPLHKLIINCSPVGTYPKEHECPAINYNKITSNHFLFDLVYNPAESLFLQKGKANGAKIKNGYDMLVYQAEKSWKIWNQ